MVDQPQGSASPKDVQGNESPEDSEETTKPSYITTEELNRAITQRLRSFEKNFESKIGSLSENLSGTLKSQLEEISKQLKPVEEVKPSKKEVDSQNELHNNPQFKAMQAELEAMKKASLLASQKAQEERAKSREMQMRSHLSETLSKQGVPADRLKHAVGFLVNVTNSVSYSEDNEDEVVFKSQDGELDLASGVKQFLKSDDGKLYLPARAINGSGDRASGKSVKESTGNVKEDIGVLLANLINGS